MKPQWGVLSLLVPVVCLATFTTAHAQSSPSRIEVGTQFSALRLSDSHSTNAGFGGRFTYDLFRWLSADSELNFFPHDNFVIDFSGGTLPGFRTAYNRQRVEGFVGPKIGVRGNRFGVFGKARPGFERLSHRGLKCVGDTCALVLLARPVYRTEFAFDLGGVLEFYPSAHAVARFDLGTTIIHHRSDAPPCRDCTSHNVASSVGFGWRFD